MSVAGLVLVFVFFVSGFAALLYQIVWQRMLSLFGGADVYAVTIIVSAFMGGLGFGSLAGGYLADRLGARGRLLAFAGCELAVAVFAAFSAAIYYDLLYVKLGSWALPRAALAAIVFAVTLWPTFFMGMSLPLLATAMTRDARRPARWVPILYGWNTLGAACGSLFAAAILFRAVDFVTSVRIGAMLSFGCALGALLGAPYLVRRWSAAAEAATDLEAPPSRPDEGGHQFGLSTWVTVYALSGFVALSLEIVWFRILGVILKSNSFTFGHLLAVYLAGVGLGSLAGNSRLARSWRPAPAFFLLQAAIPNVAVILLGLFIMSVHRIDAVDPLWQYLGRYETLSRGELVGSGTRSLVLLLYVGLPIALFGLPTLMMGLSFGYLQRAVQTDLSTLGRRVGWLQTANIIGSMAGAMLTGLVLLDRFGSDGTLRLLVSCSAVFLLLHGRLQPGRGIRPGRAAAIGLVGVVAYLTPSSSTLWARLHGAAPDQIIHAEDGSGLSLIKSGPAVGETVLYANGLGQSALPYGGVHTTLGALPAMVHPAPVSVAVIGLGSGDTLFGVGGRPETQRIDSIEIIAPELETLRELDRRRSFPALRMLLQDARVQHWFTDGRTLIRKASRRYDVIEADALRATSAYAGHLYSVEYFELLRDRLNPGGVAVTWTPTRRVIDSFVKVFPHVLTFRDYIAIGSTMPLSFDRQVIVDRMRLPFTRDYYRRGAVDIEAALAPYLAEEPRAYGPEVDRTGLVDVNRDLFPKDEFAIAYSGR